MNAYTLAALSTAILSIGSAVTAEELVPFAIPTTPNAKSLVAIGAGEPIAPDGKRIVARGGRFYRDGKRVRVWGVNTCFGANFPTHADAERVAERLAQAGINSVRLHHMDALNFPSGIWDPKDPKRLSAEALDRLDYFIDRLARRGITINANLHVSRTHSKFLGLPREGDMPSYDKVIGLFTPKLIDAQKRYARDLLTHVNKVRKVRYADDPAVAFVEITNEDSFFMWDGEYRLRTLAPYYEKILSRLWVQWLKKRYASTDALRTAWSRGAQPLGKNLIGDVGLTLRKPADANAPQWQLERHAGTSATVRALKDVENAARVEIAKVTGTDWHIQFKNVHLPLRGEQYYTLSFRARADRPGNIGVAAGMAHAPWGNLGLSRRIRLGRTWKTFRMGFTATANDKNARVSFVLGGRTGAVELADVLLATGGQVSLRKDESLQAGNVALFADSEVEARAVDRIRFLAATEKAYFDDMRAFVRKELGCKALVTGTIVFGPAGLYAQSDMDFIDAHAYWHHPHFPGRPWDMGNWLVEQSAMTDQPDRAVLAPLACRRLAGKPFTVSEYNHPAPMDAQAECVPMVAAYAAAQDWDGIWLFAYSHRTNDWDKEHFTSFFDMDANPGKFGFFGAAAIAFREAGIGPVGPAKT
ncbi:MAG TPA: carbohydrate binding domain-containing protein, partial [Phycisphaerae bacterium]|nr:carbohydrate binding domain-containing protein [Phycisphaerae bacterium]